MPGELVLRSTGDTQTQIIQGVQVVASNGNTGSTGSTVEFSAQQPQGVLAVWCVQRVIAVV